jgi:AAA family ATP:ADP antiporter
MKKSFLSILWPIEKNEQKLFIPMAIMMFFILFNFASLRAIKDSLVVPNIGAEVISFLKFWIVLPSAICFTIIYAKLSNILKFEHLFYTITSSFVLFFFFFAFVLLPNSQYIHPEDNKIALLVFQYPYLKWFIYIYSKWSYVLMYIFGELWSVVVINLMFWQFANSVTESASAKRIYPHLGLIGNIGLFAAGTMLVNFSEYENTKQDGYSIAIQNMLILIILSGICAIALMYYINNYVIKKRSFEYKSSSEKTSLSILDSFKLIVKSKYIMHIVVLVACYGIVINIVEGPWKAKIKQVYPTTENYMYFMGMFNKYLGIICVTFMLVGGVILRRMSWLFCALATPITLGVTGLLFFLFVVYGVYFDNHYDDFNPIYAAVIIGAIQNILSKSIKYSLFDSTKEMAYIPLPVELKTKGKAAAEVIGTKLGKSLGAFLQSSLFTFVPLATFDNISIYLMIVFIIVVMIWTKNVFSLNEEYKKLTYDSQN